MKDHVKYYSEIVDSESKMNLCPNVVRATDRPDIFVYLRSTKALTIYFESYTQLSRRPSVRYLRDHGITLKLQRN